MRDLSAAIQTKLDTENNLTIIPLLYLDFLEPSVGGSTIDLYVDDNLSHPFTTPDINEFGSLASIQIEENQHVLVSNVNGGTFPNAGVISYYRMAIPGDVTTMSLVSVFLPPQFNLAGAARWANNGTKLYLYGAQSDTIYEYNLLVAYDVSSAQYTGNSLLISAAIATETNKFSIEDNGTRLFVEVLTGGATITPVIMEYTLSPAYSLSGANLSVRSLNLPNVSTSVARSADFSFSEDGTQLLAYDPLPSLRSYTLNTAWRLDTANPPDIVTPVDWGVVLNNDETSAIHWDSINSILYGVSVTPNLIYTWSGGSPATQVQKYYSGSLVDLTVPANSTMPAGTYLGLGGVSTVSSTQETSDLQTPQLTVELNGIDSTYIAQVLALRYFGREAKFGLAVLDQTTMDLVGDPIILFVGFMSKLTVQLQEQTKIEVIIDSILADWERPRVKRYNTRGQNEIDPTDRGFSQVEELINKEVVWTG